MSVVSVTEPSQPEAANDAVAMIRGEPLMTMPLDLYIPPDALEVFLETFEGPLDLLLYLIKRQNLDVLDIPIAEITRQYMSYIDLMTELRLELAAEYLVMAAMLAEIKSRMLLPRPAGVSEDEADPRAELVRRLQEYERFKQAAEDLHKVPQFGRDVFPAQAEPPDADVIHFPPPVALPELLHALKDVMQRAELYTHHHIRLEPLSVRERMSAVLAALQPDTFTPFIALFTIEEGRRGVVVTFLAILELLKNALIELIQNEIYGPIYVKAPHHVDESATA